MTSLLKVKDIDQRIKDLVFGYIRIFNPQSSIPVEICQICLLFYYLIPEQFIKYDEKYMNLTSSKDQGKVVDIAEMNENSDGEWAWISVHGNLIVNPTTNPDIIVEWTIECNIQFCLIGIGSEYADQDPEYYW